MNNHPSQPGRRPSQYLIHLSQRCPKCGRHKFRAEFKTGERHYRLVAHCTKCGMGRPLSLDELHRAAMRKKGRKP